MPLLAIRIPALARLGAKLRLAPAAGLLAIVFSPVAAWAEAQATGDYRTAASGNWSVIANWERFNGTAWVAAPTAPNNTNGVITILSGHAITIAASGLSFDQVVVQAEAQVTIAPGVTATLANSFGTDLVVNGTWIHYGEAWSMIGTWSVAAGGTYIHSTTSSAAPLANATLDPASTVIYRGSQSLQTAVSFAGRTFGNLIFESTSGTWVLTGITGSSPTAINGDWLIGENVWIPYNYYGSLTLAGNFILNGTLTDGGGIQQFSFTGSGKTIGGTGSINFETLNINTGASITANAAVTQNGACTVQPGATLAVGAAFTNNASVEMYGTFQINDGGSATGNAFVYGGSSTLVFNRTTGSPFLISGGAYWPVVGGPPVVTVAGTVGVTMNVARTMNVLNMQGADMTLQSDMTVNTTLSFTSGKITTGAHQVVIAPGGSVLGAGPGRYVNGNLRKRCQISTGAGSQSWEVGDANTFAPVDFTTSTGQTQLDITAMTTAGDHAAIGSAGLTANKTANRTWKLVIDPGQLFGSASLTFHFDPTDLDPGATPTTFVLRKYDASNWTATTTGTRTSTSTQGGVSGLGEFQAGQLSLALGETHVDVPCAGGTTGSIDLTVTGGRPAYSYLWTPGGQTTQDLTGLSGGAYTVRVMDTFGDSISLVVPIAEPALLELSDVHASVSCYGASNGSIDLTVAGGTPGYMFLWSPGGATSQDRSGLGPGAYTVTVTDAHGCQATHGVTITGRIRRRGVEYTTIQDAIDAASPGDTVLVAAGTYAGPGNQNLTFGGKNLLLAYDGMVPGSWCGIYPPSEAGHVVIDCGGSGQGIIFNGGETAASVVRGFAFVNGGGTDPGAGILISGASPTFESCVISGNHSLGHGGGVAVTAGNPTFRRCTIAGNRADAFGGGLAVFGGTPQVTLEQCIVWGNCAPTGRDVQHASGSVLMTCSIVDAGGVSGSITYGSGMVFADPRFIAPLPCAQAPGTGGDWDVAPDSPALPGGNSCGLPMGAFGNSQVGVDPAAPALLWVYPSFPNPFQASSTIQFDLPGPADVRLQIFDVQGRLVRTLLDLERLESGRHERVWSGDDTAGEPVASGTYFYRLEAGRYSQVHGMVKLQ